MLIKLDVRLRRICAGLFVMELLLSGLHAQPITLEAVLQQVAAHHPGLTVFKKQMEAARNSADAPRAALDPTLSLSGGYTYDKSTNYIALFSGESSGLGLSGAYQQYFEQGWQLSASLASNWAAISPGSIYIPINPYYNAVAAVTLSKPLAKGRDGLGFQKLLKIAAAQADFLDPAYRTLLEGTLFQAAAGYWNWTRTVEIQRLKDQSLQLALSLSEAVNRKAAQGLSEQRDVLQIQSLVILRRQELLGAQQDASATWELLQKSCYWPPTRNAEPQYQFQVNLNLPDANTVFQQAQSQRADRREILQRLAANDLQIEYNQGSLQDDLAVAATVKSSSLTSDSASMLTNLFKMGNPHVELGLNYSPAWSRRSDRIALQNARVDQTRLNEQLRSFDLELAYAIQRQYDLVLTNGKKTENARALVASQKAKMDNELLSYNLGRSAIQFVIDARNDYVNAQLMLVSAQIDREIAYLTLVYLQHGLGDTFVTGL